MHFKREMFFPSLNECSEVEIRITTIGEVTIYHALNKNKHLPINHSFSKLKLDIKKDLCAARIKDKVEKFNSKRGELSAITT